MLGQQMLVASEASWEALLTCCSSFHTAVGAALGATEACPFADLPVTCDRTVCDVIMARGSLCLF